MPQLPLQDDAHAFDHAGPVPERPLPQERLGGDRCTGRSQPSRR